MSFDSIAADANSADPMRQVDGAVVFTTATNITAKRNLIERFMRAYQRATADYQLNFLSYDDGGDFIPGPNYNKYLDLIAREVQISPDVLAVPKPTAIGVRTWM
jgi:hypothetical protein